MLRCLTLANRATAARSASFSGQQPNETSNQSMKPTAPPGKVFGVLAAAPCRGLSLSRQIIVRGARVNQRTQCAHYRSDSDLVAIRFKCCETFYACIQCHEEMAGHVPLRWKKDERETHAIF